jgi:hypothetical protein
LVLLAVAAAGCGGSKTYTLEKTRSCLVARGVEIGKVPSADIVGTSATGGSFNASLGDNSVKVVFGETEGDAEQIQGAYERFAFANVKAGLADVLRRERNAVMLWQKHPQDSDLSLITGCLK